MRKGYKTKRNEKIVELHDDLKVSFHHIAQRFRINPSIAWRCYWGEKIRTGTRRGVPQGVKKYYQHLFVK